MKILFFNINRGRNNFQGIVNFIITNSDINIWCFQEIDRDALNEVCKNLKDYKIKEYSKEIENFGYFNLATFVRKDYQKINFEILEDNNNQTAPAVYVSFESGNSKYNILNFHGTYLPANKLDTKVREEASQKLINFMKNKEGIKIIGGDFNLLPDTKSIKVFEDNNYRNLIKDFKISTTRNENAWRLYPNNKQYFADYVFISENTLIKKFEVIKNDVSDHLPMMLEI